MASESMNWDELTNRDKSKFRDNADVLWPRAWLVARIFGKHGGPWGFSARRDLKTPEFGDDSKLAVKEYLSGGSEVIYWIADLWDFKRSKSKLHRKDWQVWVRLFNIHPVSVANTEQTIVPVGEVTQVDARVDLVTNDTATPSLYKGILTLEKEKELKRSSTFRAAFKQGVSAAVGSSGVFFDASVTVEALFEQVSIASSEDDEREHRSYGQEWQQTIPPYSTYEITSNRKVQPSKAIVKGQVKIECGIQAGIYGTYNKDWIGHVGLKRHASYDSTEEFLETVSGNGSRDRDYWEEFRNKPLKDPHLQMLRENLEVAEGYQGESKPFDNVLTNHITLRDVSSDEEKAKRKALEDQYRAEGREITW